MNATTIRTFLIAALVLAALCASTLAAQPLPAPSVKEDIKSVVKAHTAEVQNLLRNSPCKILRTAR
jgi:hypothetical protein